MVELLRNSQDKRARKLAKKRVRLRYLCETPNFVSLGLGDYGLRKSFSIYLQFQWAASGWSLERKKKQSTLEDAMHISHVAKAGGVEDSEADHPHPQWLQDSNANTCLSQTARYLRPRQAQGRGDAEGHRRVPSRSLNVFFAINESTWMRDEGVCWDRAGAWTGKLACNKNSNCNNRVSFCSFVDFLVYYGMNGKKRLIGKGMAASYLYG